MPQVKNDSRFFRARVSPSDLDAVAQMIVELGFVYGEGKPYWSKWFEAIAKGDVLLFKKVEPPS